MSNLYNDGTGISYVPTVLNTAPDVNLISPANNTNFSMNYGDFVCNSTDTDNNLVNLTLVLDGVDTNTVTNTSTVQQNLTLNYTVTGLITRDTLIFKVAIVNKRDQASW